MASDSLERFSFRTCSCPTVSVWLTRLDSSPTTTTSCREKSATREACHHLRSYMPADLFPASPPGPPPHDLEAPPACLPDVPLEGAKLQQQLECASTELPAGSHYKEGGALPGQLCSTGPEAAGGEAAADCSQSGLGGTVGGEGGGGRDDEEDDEDDDDEGKEVADASGSEVWGCIIRWTVNFVWLGCGALYGQCWAGREGSVCVCKGVEASLWEVVDGGAA